MIKLTARQNEVLELIKRHIKQSGMPPTRADIATELGFRSPNAAEEHLKALARKGAIEMIPGASRGIRIPQQENLGLPIIGRVAAGLPINAIEHIEDYCKLPDDFFHPPANYLLHVHGESMINIGIMDGDLLAVHNCQDASEGQIIVARVDDDVTVKRYKKGKAKHEVLLLPENDELSPIKVDLREQKFVIEGISVGIIRKNH